MSAVTLLDNIVFFICEIFQNKVLIKKKIAFTKQKFDIKIKINAKRMIN